MQPKIISKDRFYITGLTGDGAKIGEVWNDFDNHYKSKPFPKTDKSGYEIRFWDGEKHVVSGKDIHIGFKTESNANIDGFTTITLPTTEYAVFDVYVSKGYDSGNAEIDKWLTDNAVQFGQLQFEGQKFVVECYNEKFKCGNKPDSVVEIWIPLFRFCQCCAMPMTKLEDFGTEADGNQNSDYCKYCYENESFEEGKTMEEVIDVCIPFCLEAGEFPDAETARTYMMSFFPKLKRWTK